VVGSKGSVVSTLSSNCVEVDSGWRKYPGWKQMSLSKQLKCDILECIGCLCQTTIGEFDESDAVEVLTNTSLKSGLLAQRINMAFESFFFNGAGQNLWGQKQRRSDF
jgi:hypothetical protein